VFTISSIVRAYVCTQPVDMRKSFDGLSAAVSALLCEDPLSGHLFVFINRRRDIVKVLFWDRSGYCVFAKRLEAGTFRLPKPDDPNATGNRLAMTVPDLTLLLEGIDLNGARRRKRFSLENHA
jgi:transposase